MLEPRRSRVGGTGVGTGSLISTLSTIRAPAVELPEVKSTLYAFATSGLMVVVPLRLIVGDVYSTLLLESSTSKTTPWAVPLSWKPLNVNVIGVPIPDGPKNWK